jgi:response regulator RpfG family c-di-GMP phosphodiesterase
MDRRRPSNPPVRPLVLIVEGRDDTRALCSLALSSMGFDVITARDDPEASRRALETRPDIIVTDLQVPNHDGCQFLRELREDPRTRDIPIVAGFFPKPCLLDELAATLRQVLDGRAHAALDPIQVEGSCD